MTDKGHIRGLEYWDQAKERLLKDIKLLASAGFNGAGYKIADE